MADEITYSGRLKAVKGNINVLREHLNKTVTMTGDALSHQVQDIPTTASGTALDIGAAVGTEGYAMFINLDSTNFVQIGVENAGTFYPAIKLKAGESAGPLRMGSELTHAVADTATVPLEFFILED